MTLNVAFDAKLDSWTTYKDTLNRAFKEAGLSVDLRQDHPPEEVDYIIFAPQPGPALDFSQFSRLRGVLSLWAGVERIVANDTLRVPLTRMVDSGLREGMVEWVCAHVLRYHMNIDRHITSQSGTWDPQIPPLARNRNVGILGLGALGKACATTLTNLNFTVSGWSLSQKSIANITCYAGDELPDLLQTCEILVLLLPLTEDTENIPNADTLARLPKGSRILNPGRGALIDDAALLAALRSGHIAHATLDVFRTEPLPPEDPYWAHPNVTVTPHIASETRPDSAAQVIAENIRRFEAGEDPLFLVNRSTGY
jgi:glyoxylate/hydroxypyruvate reductase A